jgi:hypothetical protein
MFRFKAKCKDCGIVFDHIVDSSIKVMTKRQCCDCFYQKRREQQKLYKRRIRSKIKSERLK